MTWSGVSKFFLGFILAIAILFGTGMAVTRYVMARLSVPPPRPSFSNDPSPSPVAAAAPSASPGATPAASPAASPAATPSPTPSPTEYTARVTQPIGLILRQDPSMDSDQAGGVEYNQEVTVLEDSQDGQWQRVRLANGSEGWVRAGNTERAN